MAKWQGFAALFASIILTLAIVRLATHKETTRNLQKHNLNVAFSKSAEEYLGDSARKILEPSLLRIQEAFPDLQTQIFIDIDEKRTIPEIGSNGFTDPGDGRVSIWIDPSPPGGRTALLGIWLPATLAHELHHSIRILHGPGYGISLGEALVTEGLADAFVHEAFPSTPALPWDAAIDDATQSRMWKLAQPKLLDSYSLSDHRRWFFGGDGIPRWTGYTLGYRLATSYLESSSGTSARTAYNVSAKEVLEAAPW